MTSLHFYAWKNGLKTGMYYLRARPAADAIKFTLDVETLLKEAGEIKIEKENQKKSNEVLEKENNKENNVNIQNHSENEI